MKNESDVKRHMVKSMIKSGGYGRRIEDQYAVGVMDTILIPKAGPVFFAEAKIIRASSFGPTPRQLIELERIAGCDSPHVIPVVIGWRDGIFYFHAPQPVIGIDECYWTDTNAPFYDQLVAYSTVIRKANEPKP